VVERAGLEIRGAHSEPERATRGPATDSDLDDDEPETPVAPDLRATAPEGVQADADAPQDDDGRQAGLDELTTLAKALPPQFLAALVDHARTLRALAGEADG
jgi:hypothetical protein